MKSKYIQRQDPFGINQKPAVELKAVQVERSEPLGRIPLRQDSVAVAPRDRELLLGGNELAVVKSG